MKHMNLFLLILCFLVYGQTLHAQKADSLKTDYTNTAEKLIAGNKGLGFGGYGEVHYNQPLSADYRESATLDVHRIVLFVGYNFSKNTQFVSEIEFEHANELWIEQAFLQHRLHKNIQFRAGLLLVPMGIINETHEPTTFHGVERPVIDNRIAPSTWREIGAGFAGTLHTAKLKYQAYVMNGLNGFSGSGVFSGSKALRDGRQKGSNAYMTSPAFAGRLEYYGFYNLNLGLSAYAGKSQSKLLQHLHRDSIALQDQADSSVVGIAMLGLDARYQYQGLKVRGQLYYTTLSNTKAYNQFTAKSGSPNDLGKSMTGFYVEASYNLFRHFDNIHSELTPFFRYERMNTHASVESPLIANKAYATTWLTTGISWFPVKNAVVKADLQFSKSEAESKFSKTLNAGIGFMF